MKTDEFCITVVCDGLHTDDIEELQRAIAGSRYNFKVDVARRVRAESYPELNVIGIHTKLIVRFFAKWFYCRTEQRGVKAIVRAIDEVLDRSIHDRDRRPKVSFDSDGQEFITTERWLRPRTKKHSWTRDHKLALGILVATALAVVAVFVVPEVRQFLHLKPETTSQAEPEKQSSTPSVTTPAGPRQPDPKATQPSTDDVKPIAPAKPPSRSVGSVVTNPAKTENPSTPSISAPNGIAIGGGIVNNPTVNNNYGPPPPPTPTVTICVTHPTPAEGTERKTVLTFKTDVEIMEAWYALLFDGPVGEGSVEMPSGSFGYTHGRADKMPNPERSFVFRNTSINFGVARWLPNNPMKVTVPSKDPVNLVKILSGSGENGRDEVFVYRCD